MTTIITRAYADRSAADAVVADLKKVGYLDEMISIVDAGDGAAAALRAADVDEAAADAFASATSEGNAILVARVPFFPIGAALQAIKIADAAGPIAVEAPKTDRYVRTDGSSGPRSSSKVADVGDGLMLGRGLEPGYSKRHKYYSTGVGWSKLISDRKPPEHSIDTRFWGMVIPHILDRKPPDNTIDTRFWGQVIPHISQRKPPADTIDTRYWGELIPHIIRR